MKKLFSITIAIVLILTLFASCGKPETALTATELLDLGEKYLLDLDYEQAIVYFNQVIEVEPRNSRAYMGAAEAYVGLGDTESAISILKTALDVFSDDDSVSIELLEMLIEINPTTAEWYLDLAQIYINQGNTDKAIEVLQQGMANASETAEIEALLAELTEEEPVEVESAYETDYGVLNNDMLRTPTYFDKSTITEIDFLDSLDSAPSDAWDFSLDGDGSVLGWLDGTHLYVAGDGGVIVDEDASSLFGFEVHHSDGSIHGSDYLTSINFNGCFDTSGVTDMSFMFSGCTALSALDLSSFDTSKVTDMESMFQCCEALTSLDLDDFNTSNVTDMSFMFNNCASLAPIDVSKFDTSQVTNMESMFSNCDSLITLDLSNFDTANVTDMKFMFSNCDSLISINLTGFDTSNVIGIGMMYMFSGCVALSTLDLDSFDTSNVTSMGWMFENCTSLTTLDLSSFNTSKVTGMTGMFEYCSSLTTLDVSSFDTSNVLYMINMFSGCTSLTSLDISNFDTSNADTTDMFKDTIFE